MGCLYELLPLAALQYAHVETVIVYAPSKHEYTWMVTGLKKTELLNNCLQYKYSVHVHK